MLFKLWNYIRGYVIIKVEGYFLEKFINICVHRHISMWNVEKLSNRQMILFISISDFLKLRPVAKKSKCHVSIIEKCGIPFLIRRYKARKAFAIGVCIFATIVLFLSSFVWNVEITGNNTIDSQILIDKLADLGGKPGVLKAHINTKSIADEMILSIKELAWINVEVRGTKLIIKVAERKIPPKLIPSNVPCDIFASKDGIIKAIVAKAGIEVVKSGTTVKKGQLLVTGVVPNKNENEPSRIVHAMATVKARTWYEERVEVITKVSERTCTNSTKYMFYLSLLGKSIKLIPGKISFENFDKTIEEKRLSIGKDMDLPLVFKIEKYTEILINEKELPFYEAGQIAMNTANKQITDQIPPAAEIIKTDSRFVNDTDGKIYAVLTVECIEDIGEEKQIGGN